MTCSTWFSHDFKVRKRYVFRKIYVFLTFLHDQNLSSFGSVNLVVTFLKVKVLSVLSFLFQHFFCVVPEFSILNYLVSPFFWYFTFSSN